MYKEFSFIYNVGLMVTIYVTFSKESFLQFREYTYKPKIDNFIYFFYTIIIKVSHSLVLDI